MTRLRPPRRVETLMPKHAARTTTRNGLLAALPAEIHTALLPKFETVSFHPRQALFRSETRSDAVYFLESGWLSLIASLDDGTEGEVGCVGREGMVPLSLVLGVDASYVDPFVQHAGSALRMVAEQFRIEMDSLPALRIRLLRYAEAMHAQAIQITVCNGRHALEQRVARWLLMAHDRVEADDIAITQEMLALMLCVYRPSVSVAVRSLQKAGLIRHRPGRITILNRALLESAACGCYGMVAARFRHLLS
jgi:CRP-like cAMP-binding protein